MQDRVRLLGVAVDIASTNAAGDAAIRYIEEESTRAVYCVNSETLILLEKNEEQELILEGCDMILPGTVSVSASVDEVLGYKRDPFFLESYFDRIFDYAVENGKEILILALNENVQLELLKHYRDQMNAGLILFTGNILYNKAVSEAKVPESIEKLRIGNLYKWFQKDSSGKNLFNNIKMKFRIKRDK